MLKESINTKEQPVIYVTFEAFASAYELRFFCASLADCVSVIDVINFTRK